MPSNSLKRLYCYPMQTSEVQDEDFSETRKLSRQLCDSFVILKVFLKFNSDLDGKMFETNFDWHLDIYLLAQTLSELIL